MSIIGVQLFSIFKLILCLNTWLFFFSDSPEPLPPAFKDGEVYFGDRTQLLDHELLTQFDLAVNKTYGFVACIHPQCGYELVGDIENHLRGHKVRISKAELGEIVALKSNPKEIPLNGEILPVQGLKLNQGFCCLLCPGDAAHCAKTKQVLRNHNSKEHRNYQLRVEGCTFQRRGVKAKNFKVSCLSSSSLFFPFSFPPSFRAGYLTQDR